LLPILINERYQNKLQNEVYLSQAPVQPESPMQHASFGAYDISIAKK
jgi:hypothetical protein